MDPAWKITRKRFDQAVLSLSKSRTLWCHVLDPTPLSLDRDMVHLCGISQTFGGERTVNAGPSATYDVEADR